MRGIQGLLLAIALGIAGAAFNWLYLTSKSGVVETVAFVGVKPDVDIEQGEILREEDLVPVRIPRGSVGNLEHFAVLYSDLPTVVGHRVAYSKAGKSLLLQHDLQTPRQELKLADDEVLIWVPVDTRTFVPSLVKPGDQVEFVVTSSGFGYPTLAEDADPAAGPPIPESPPTAGPIDTIGPFKILSLGNRLGSADVLRAAKVPQTQENVMGIAVKVDQDGNMAANAQKLMKLLEATAFRPMGIILHPRRSDAE